MPIHINPYRSRHVGASVIIACLMAASSAAQTAREVRGAAAVEPLQNEPPAKIIIDPPLAEPLSRGRVVIQYRTDNLHVVPVFGPAALASATMAPKSPPWRPASHSSARAGHICSSRRYLPVTRTFKTEEPRGVFDLGTWDLRVDLAGQTPNAKSLVSISTTSGDLSETGINRDDLFQKLSEVSCR